MSQRPSILHPRSLGGVILGLSAFLATLIFFQPADAPPETGKMAAVVVLMAIWWILEPVPFGVTALLPFVLFPLLGLMSGAQIAPFYFNSIIFLFLGGFLIALAMERWDLHRRIALQVLLWFGHSPATLVLGFMVACALLSAWISNTATTLAMLPVGLAVLQRLEEQYDKKRVAPLGIAIMLGIAYASSLGGIATPVGTPPNLAFRAIYTELFPGAPTVSFAQWCLFAAPLALTLLAITWLVLTQWLFRSDSQLKIERHLLESQMRALGSITREEKWVGLIFITTALLWIFREPIVIEQFRLPGWQSFLPFAKGIDDGTVAITMAIILFLIPAQQSGNTTRLLTESVIRQIPWSIILLFGGGYAMAKGFQDFGLSQWMAATFFGDFGSLGIIGMVAVVCLVMTFLTEFTSNTPSTQIVLPVVAATAVAENIDPLLLMLPATLSASMAFMMPVGTPPNAIVFGSGRVPIGQMIRAGLVLNLVGVAAITAAILLLAKPLLNL